MKKIFTVLLVCAAAVSAGSQTKSKLLADIDMLVLRYEFENTYPSKIDPRKMTDDRMKAVMGVNPDELAASIEEQVRKNPAGAYVELSKAMRAPDLTDAALTVYMWAISHTKNAKAADDVINVATKRKNANVKSVIDALDRIGGDRAKDYLFGMIDGNQDENIKFAILSSLSGHKYARALPVAGLYLKEDMNESYWKMLIVFGKYGTACEQFLMGKIGDLDRTIRYNAIFILGNVLLHTPVAPAVMKAYGDEKDAEIRRLMLTVAINLLHDWDAVFAFLGKAAGEEKDKETADMARKYAADRAMIENKVAEYRKAKKVNGTELQKVYDRSMKSLGKDCDFYAVSILSDVRDEAMLVRMRENFLLRNSDECLIDLNKLNLLILYNRFIPAK